MKILRFYWLEAKFLKWYILASIVAIIASYSVYAFFSVETVARMGSEDRLFEWLTALCFLFTSVLFGLLFIRRRNIFFIVFSIVFFFGFGEEISWGQRIIGFKTPDAIHMHNVQREFNLHNIELLNRENKQGEAKTGLSRLLEVNLIFKVFTIILAFLLPIAVFHSRAAARMSRAVAIPVPPATIAVFFAVNWIAFKLVLDYFLPSGKIFQYYDTDTEIFEFVSAFIILAISIYFFRTRDLIVTGEDIKSLLIAPVLSGNKKEQLPESVKSASNIPETV